MGGKSSGSGARVANTANRDLGGAGSMINRSPSFRMMASSPRNSNSRGDPHCPIAAIPKDSDVTFWTHNEPPPSICLSRCQTISYVHSGKDFSLA